MTTMSTPPLTCGCACPTHESVTKASSDPSNWMTPEELVARLKGAITLGTLRNYRSARIGPTYIKIGRAIFYPTDAVNAWLEAQAEAANDHWHDRA